MVKIAAMATVQPGIAFWALMGLTACVGAATRSLDRHRLWRRIETLPP